MTTDTTALAVTPARVRCTARPGSPWTKCACPRHRTAMMATRRAHYHGTLEDPRPDALVLLRYWTRLGWSPLAIESATGIGRKTATQMLQVTRAGGTPRLVFRTATALLAWTPPVEGTLGITGTRRRLQALAAAGWTREAIASATHVGHGHLGALRTQEALTVYVHTANAIADLYRRAGSPPGGVNRQTQRYAGARGWVPPIRWEHLDMDDPAVEPHPAGVDLHNPFDPTDRVILDRIREAVGAEKSDAEIGAAIGMSPSGIQKLRNRHGIRRRTAA